MYIYVLIYAYVYKYVCNLYEQGCGGGATRATIQTPTSVAATTMYMYTHMYVHVYIYMYVCIYIYIYICIYVC